MRPNHTPKRNILYIKRYIYSSYTYIVFIVEEKVCGRMRRHIAYEADTYRCGFFFLKLFFACNILEMYRGGGGTKQ